MQIIRKDIKRKQGYFGSQRCLDRLKFVLGREYISTMCFIQVLYKDDI